MLQEVSREQREAPVRRAGEGHRAELEKLSAQAGLLQMPLCLAASASSRKLWFSLGHSANSDPAIVLAETSLAPASLSGTSRS